jgi:hypothetical protein
MAQCNIYFALHKIFGFDFRRGLKRLGLAFRFAGFPDGLGSGFAKFFRLLA